MSDGLFCIGPGFDLFSQLLVGTGQFPCPFSNPLFEDPVQGSHLFFHQLSVGDIKIGSQYTDDLTFRILQRNLTRQQVTLVS